MESKFVYIVATLLLAANGCKAQCLTENDDVEGGKAVDLSKITGFGLELFRELFPYNETKNFFFSPYSIWNVLTLAYFGSEGHTRTQLQKVLRLTDKVTTMREWKKLNYMYELRQLNNTDYTFSLASKAYFDESVAVKPCLKKLLDNEIESVDFSLAAKTTRMINDFVKYTTKNRITDIITEGDIQNSRMALINAAFFKGTWLSQFKKSKTAKELFYSSESEYYFVKMMKQKGKFRSGPSEKFKAYLLELPYSGKEISMIILLPPFSAFEAGFNYMVENLDADVLQQEIDNLIEDDVQVQLPKFKIEETIGDELVSSLKKMGVKDLFDPLRSNLTAFDANGGLNGDKMLHKATFKVDEKGGEAAAATTLVQWRMARPLEPTEFICNHPFLFVLFDKVTKNILFLGAYKNPKM